MSTRICITLQNPEFAWLQHEAERLGMPLVSVVPRVLFSARLAEEDRDRTTVRPAAVPQSSSTTAAAQLQPTGPGEGHDTRAQALAAMRKREQQTPLAQPQTPDDIPAWQAQAPDEVPSAIRLDGAQRYIASNGIAETRRQLSRGELEDYWWSSAVEYALEK